VSQKRTTLVQNRRKKDDRVSQAMTTWTMPISGCKAHLRWLNGNKHLMLVYRRFNRRKHIKNIIINLYAWVNPTNTWKFFKILCGLSPRMILCA